MWPSLSWLDQKSGRIEPSKSHEHSSGVVFHLDDYKSVNRDPRDEHQRSPRAAKEEQLWRVIATCGADGMPEKKAFGVLSEIWQGMSWRTFQEYVFTLEARDCITSKTDERGMRLFISKPPPKRAMKGD